MGGSGEKPNEVPDGAPLNLTRRNSAGHEKGCLVEECEGDPLWDAWRLPCSTVMRAGGYPGQETAEEAQTWGEWPFMGRGGNAT